jgi:hypothetical protein
MPQAREAVAAALATGDTVTVAIEGMRSFMGHGRADLNILAGRLENLGLNEDQIRNLLNEVVLRAQTLIGPEGVDRIKQILPALEERSSREAEPERPGTAGSY